MIVDTNGILLLSLIFLLIIYALVKLYKQGAL